MAQEQVTGFYSGNEMAALSGSDINFHVMGYYPITPSTEVAEYLNERWAEGENQVVMVPGDGEHGAAGICTGATTAGGRVFNATSANGLLFALEQLPVQSGLRMPMLLNLSMRAVSGPLDIRGDHSDVMYTLNTGWLILFAKDPQAVYDMNIIGLKLAESEGVLLPVIVAYDGFFTSHQKRKVFTFADKKVVQDFLGAFKAPYTSVDPTKPIMMGAYMNDPDLINNKVQLNAAMLKALETYPKILKEYAALSGRDYSIIDSYQMEDAEIALCVVNSAYETAKEAVDTMRAKGQKVGAFMPTIMRPFPEELMAATVAKAKVVIVGDRQDSYGAGGGNLSLELRAALNKAGNATTKVLSRVYGVGGKEFFVEDAEELINLAIDLAAGKKVEPFAYHGANAKGVGAFKMEPIKKPLTIEDFEKAPTVTKNAEGKFEVSGVQARKLAAMPNRISQGHGACPGCGIFPALNTFFKGISGHVVVLFHTGCGMVVTSGYPYSSHNITYIHNLFQNGPAAISGVVEMYAERQRRGEIPADQEITFVMVSGDGGMDIGMGPAIGTALRNHKLIMLEYDNQGYMNTGHQLSFSTPMGHATSTSNIGEVGRGKTFHHKDTASIMAACNMPYVFTAAVTNEKALYGDLIKKAAKAQAMAREYGTVYGKLFITCPLNWRSDEKEGLNILQAAVDSCFFPIYEIEHGITTINYNPETAKRGKVGVGEWLKMMGKTKHMTTPNYVGILDDFQKEVDRRWVRLKERANNPLL